MFNRMLVRTLVLGMIASTAAAEISIIYDPVVIDQNTSTEVAVSLLANDDFGESTIGAVVMNYDVEGSQIGPDQLNPTNWTWAEVFTGAIPGGGYFFLDVELPHTIQAVCGCKVGVGPPIQSGQLLQIATLTLSPGQHDAETAYLLAVDAEIADSSEFVPFEIKGGNPATIVVTPEPASLSLLALGAFAVLRRNRR